MRANLLLLVASSVAALLLAEVVTRLVARELPVETWGRETFCTNPEGLRIMRPGVRARQFGGEFDVRVSANSTGYRDEEWSDPDGSFRVLVLGDSFGWGWGVPADSMIVEGIESMPGVRAYNLSMPGDDLVSMYHRYATHVDEIDPHLVVILSYVNDFVEIERQRNRLARFEESEDPKSSARCASLSERGIRGWLDESHLYRLVNRFRLQRGIRILPEAHRRGLRREWYASEKRLLSDAGMRRSAFAFYGELLARIARDREVLVASVPPAYRFGGTLQEQLLEAVEGWERVDPEVWERELESLSEATGVAYVNLADALEDEARKRSLYFERDGHMNATAQARAGRYLAREIGRIADLTDPAPRGGS